MKEKKYLGFGVEKSVSGWSKFLGLPYATVWRQLNNGLTPEEIATEKGLILDMSRLDEMPEKEKRRLAEVKQIIEDILDSSDYDPDGLEVSPAGDKGMQSIVWNDLKIGVYNYQKDALYLTGGDGLRIRHPLVPDPKIARDDSGRWNIHPETKRLLFNQII